MWGLWRHGVRDGREDQENFPAAPGSGPMPWRPILVSLSVRAREARPKPEEHAVNAMSHTTTQSTTDRPTHPRDVVPPDGLPAGPPVLSRRMVQVAGALGLTHVVLLLAGIGLQDSVLFSEGREGMTSYADGSLSRSVAGGYVELIGFLIMLPVLVAVASIVGRSTSGGRWAAQTALLAGLGYVVVTFSPGMAAGAVAMHAAQNGVDVDTAWTLNNLRVISYVLSLMLLGAHAIGVGIAARADRFGTRTVGWFGIATGVVLLTAPLLLAPNLHDLTTLVWAVWWVVLCIRLLRQN